MKFEHIETNRGESSGGSNFLKLNDGESVTGILRGEVYKFYQVWPQGGQKQIFTEPTPGASARFRVNVVIPENKTYRPLLWEFGVTVNNQLADLSGEMDLSTTKLKITRRGIGKKTMWTAVPLGQIDQKTVKALDDVSLNVLEHKETNDVPF